MDQKSGPPITRRSMVAGMSTALGAAQIDAAVRPLNRRMKVSGNMPAGFLWGAASAGHQVEGNNVNSDFWFIEHHANSPLFPDKSGDADDHYHRFEQDIALLASLGLNAFRFSLEWSRIEPEQGEYSKAEREHYRRVAACCREHGVTPVLTYTHYTAPLWFAKLGGWENPSSPDRFARYCEFASKGIGDLAGLATTINEPQGARLIAWFGPEAVSAMKLAISNVTKAACVPTFSNQLVGNQEAMLPHLIRAHQLGYDAIKAGPGDYPVGVSLAIVDDQAVGPGSKRDAKRADVNGAWLAAAKATGDFVGVQTYTRAQVDAKGVMKPPPGAVLNQTGDEIYPAALGNAIRYVYEATGKPIYVTENGLATLNDRERATYIPEALMGLKACIDDGIPVRGYIHWCLLDDYEWGHNDWRYGLVAVDPTTQKRTIKPSAHVLGHIARANRV